MKKIILITLLISVFLLTVVSAVRTADFYYSPTCSHCQAVAPLIQELSQTKFDENWYWYFNDITQGSYAVDGVPTLIFDNKIKLVGDYEISKYAKCYLAEQSSLECPTSTTYNCTTGWFIRE